MPPPWPPTTAWSNPSPPSGSPQQIGSFLGRFYRCPRATVGACSVCAREMAPEPGRPEPERESREETRDDGPETDRRLRALPAHELGHGGLRHEFERASLTRQSRRKEPRYADILSGTPS